ncbi:hypothetical protein B0H16DRAFT_1469424 [Mycena metata]|uniref:Uncharacterized protein n=1 Tax=Mycena metata TaxID=1033252 RepID=A0AAD7HY22_9AGAR|nr:hypothetical protein B0H16DRAFT_1469424 [Mycena metata]
MSQNIGFKVTLLEQEHFPRYHHIGQSLLPSCRPFLRFIGAEQKIIDFGFCVKVGAALKFNQTEREGYSDFTEEDVNKGVWNVTRADFDEILLRNASENGVRVYEGISVKTIEFSLDNPKQPVSATWKSDRGIVGVVKFKWLALKHRRETRTRRGQLEIYAACPINPVFSPDSDVLFGNQDNVFPAECGGMFNPSSRPNFTFLIWSCH